MKINETQRIGAINQYKKAGDSKSAHASGRKEKQKDEVLISTQAKELLENTVTIRSSEQNQRLEELKQSVATGTYYVEARKIAEKLFPFIK